MSGPPVTIELNPKERRLYDRLRERIVVPVPGGRSGLRDLLLLLPDLTVLLMRLLRDARVPLLPKGVAIAGVAYVLSPIDLVPSLVFGPIGVADDLFVVAACLSHLLNRVHPDVVRGHWSGRGDALDAIQTVTDFFEREFRLRTADLLRVLRRP
ncbi:MAG TPA: DUF1232 domain-containing protein [Myxococcota bacterium]|nr:DUF1232 domain-containing protein [Myxococcales bacterium]HPG24445.1 DUF1232 domain-containing protein [Myxococcota bacterium]